MTAILHLSAIFELECGFITFNIQTWVYKLFVFYINMYFPRMGHYDFEGHFEHYFICYKTEAIYDAL